jgi:endonuclease/exonuclease/phosphatase family metal-dependent hydrolase
MKIVTFNIRCDCKVDQENNFEFRKPLILQKITLEKPEIICFQEVMSHVATWLNDELKDYTIIGCGRDENLDGEQVSIAFRKDSFLLVAADHFWHSDTPLVPGSRFLEQSIFPRLCTQCYLVEHNSKKVIRVVNTHLDHISSQARVKELELIMNIINPISMYNETITVFAGDLNATPSSQEMKVLNQYPDFKCLTENIGITYHGYFKDEQVLNSDETEQIDYIYARGNLDLISVEKWSDVQDGVYLSDHYPVSVEFEID